MQNIAEFRIIGRIGKVDVKDKVTYLKIRFRMECGYDFHRPYCSRLIRTDKPHRTGGRVVSERNVASRTDRTPLLRNDSRTAVMLAKRLPVRGAAVATN